MRLTTLGVLAAASMSVTSLSVWALAPVGGPTPTRVAVGDPASAPKSALADLLGLGALPAGEAEFTAGTTVVMKGRLGHRVLAADEDSETFLLLELQAELDQIASTPAPVNLSIVLDRSRSMQGQRLQNAMAAARGMIRRLRDGDTVSVVTYNTTTEVLLPPTVVDDRSRERLAFGLGSVEARGHTCISCGIEAGMNLLSERTSAVNRMLLLSDGEANTGIRDVDGFRRLAGRARAMETPISSIGVDVDYNERIMFAVAQESNGRHYFVENPSGLPRIFDDELRSLVQTVASQAEVEVDLAPGVQVVEVLDRAFRRDGNRLVVPFGAFSSGDAKTLLVRLRLPRGEPGRQPVADVRLAYADLATGKRSECRGELAAQLTDRPDEVEPLDPLVEARVARSETASAILRANELFSAGEVEAAQRTIADNRGRVRRRRARASSRARRKKDKIALDNAFGSQLEVLEDAEGGFSAAQEAEPLAPATSRTGKSAVRRNASKVDAFFE